MNAQWIRLNVVAARWLAACLSGLVLLGSFAPASLGQTSSLYVTDPDTPPQPVQTRRGTQPSLSPAIAQRSLMAVPVPEPRQFGVHDLISIVIRESTQSGSEGEFDASKSGSVDAGVETFVDLDASKLLKSTLGRVELAGRGPALEGEFDSEYKGDGSYERRDSITGMIQAEIIDIKPNGNLVLAARKYYRTDDETVRLTLTGVCRPEDVTADNSVLSSQLHDLRLNKEHTGDVRKASRKGWLTRVVEAIFDF